MAQERRAKQITIVLELEDNCGAVLKRCKKIVEVVRIEAEVEEGIQDVIKEFAKFVDGIPNKLEI
jgi:hypothetical protein